MKHYLIDHQTYEHLPDPCRGCSPMTEARFIEMGGTVQEDGKPSPEEEFVEAAGKFRTLCDDIGQFIGEPSFMGSFEEMSIFQDSLAAWEDPITAYRLGLRLMELNEECKYKGSKIGLGQPAWFYRCWELAAEGQTEA